MKKIFIVSGESSGELYGALLTRSLKKKWSGLRVLGVGGERMRREGVEIVSEISGAFGLVELISSLKKIKETYRKVVQTIFDENPDVLVLIDFPDFNIKVARAVRHSGVRILYYVSPQVWAWRQNRVHIIAELSDFVALILPFEKDYYKETGVECEFVGHPILEEFESLRGHKGMIKEEMGLKPDAPVLALLPGSRDSELDRLLPVMINFAGIFKRSHTDYQLIMPVALNVHKNRHGDYFERLGELGVTLVDGEAVKVLFSSDIAVIASGTAALQAALLGIPLVVIYKLFPLTYFLGKMIIKVKYINLVNIMMDQQVIKELLQGKASPANVYSEVTRIIHDDEYRRSMLNKFGEVRTLFTGKNASERVSEIVGNLTGWN